MICLPFLQGTGTRVVFKPDPLIFKTTTEFEYDKLASRLDELAYLNAGITITMVSSVVVYGTNEKVLEGSSY